MLIERNLLFFPDFYFKNGGHKAKYFLVLKVSDDNTVLASLPSSQDYVPAYAEGQTDCIDIPEASFNCFRFEKDVRVTEDSNFCFSKTTFLYGQLLDFYDNQYFDDYPVEGIDYEIKGLLSEALFDQIIDCFKKSSSVKRKFQRLL